MTYPNGVVRILILAVAAATAAGCVTDRFPKAPRMGPDDFPNARPPVSAGPSSTGAHVPIAPDVEFLEVDSPEMNRALEQFATTGKPPVIKRKHAKSVRFPFGHSYPILYCKALRVCDLELQPGEKVINVAMGDNERWESFPMENGPVALRTPHVVFTPHDADYRFSTNAIITTDRRVYHLGLIAVNDEDGRRHYDRHASFYYPDDTVQTWMTAQERKAEQRAAAEAARLAATEPGVPPKLYYGYEISGDTVPWRPEEVFDDGTRVYIKMPVAGHVTESPGLWVIDEHGQQNLVNYRLRDGHFIVDKLFSKARMAVGVGRKADEIFITRQKPSEADLADVPDGESQELAARSR